MTTETYPPISPGTSVKTTQPNLEKRREWTDKGWASKKWGVRGSVITHHDSHGLCYDVRHEDGTEGSYDPSELEIIVTEERGIILDELQEEAEKLLSLLQDRRPGLYTWNRFLKESMGAMHSLLDQGEVVT